MLRLYREKVSREETIPKAPNQCWTTRGHFPPPQGRNHFLLIGEVSSVRTACTQQTWWPIRVPVCGKLRQTDVGTLAKVLTQGGLL